MRACATLLPCPVPDIVIWHPWHMGRKSYIPCAYHENILTELCNQTIYFTAQFGKNYQTFCISLGSELFGNFTRTKFFRVWVVSRELFMCCLFDYAPCSRVIGWGTRRRQVPSKTSLNTNRTVPWLDKNVQGSEFLLTQFLTGHANFEAYPNKSKREESLLCMYCPTQEDDVNHPFFECVRWRNLRR